MKRFRKYMTTAVLGFVLCLGSCAKESLSGSEPGPGGGDANNFFTLKIDLGGRKSRSWFEGILDGSAHEMMVEKARVVIYAKGAVHYVKELDITNIDDNGVSLTDFKGADVDWHESPYLCVTKPIDLKAEGFDFNLSDYKLLLLLNPNPEITAITTKGRPLADLERASNYSATSFIGANGNRFLMGNAQELVKITPSSHFHKTEAGAKRSPLFITLFRSVATVCFTVMDNNATRAIVEEPFPSTMELDYSYWMERKDDSRDVYYIADIESVQWGVNVVNKKSYWLRKMTYDCWGVMEENLGYLAADFSETYAEDPNFEGFSMVNNGSQQDRDNNFEYITDDSQVNMSLTPLVFDDDMWMTYPVRKYEKRGVEYAYIPENTMGPRDQYVYSPIGERGAYDVATCVVVGMNLYARDSDETRANAPLEKHIFLCKDYGMTFGQEYLNELLKEFYDMMMAGEQEVEDGYWALLQSVFEPVVRYLLTEKNWNGSSDPDWDNYESFQLGRFTFYNNSRMYFTIPIEHFAEWQAGEYYGAGYGVVRNNIYLIASGRYIFGFGSPYPEVPSNLIETVKVLIFPWEHITNDYLVGKEPPGEM